MRTAESSLEHCLQVFFLPASEVEKRGKSSRGFTSVHFLHGLVRISPVTTGLNVTVEGNPKLNCIFNVLHSKWNKC